jgi:flagellar biosynthesis/type III secretory pathway M-ring protein FliF/YscJ
LVLFGYNSSSFTLGQIRSGGTYVPSAQIHNSKVIFLNLFIPVFFGYKLYADEYENEEEEDEEDKEGEDKVMDDEENEEEDADIDDEEKEEDEDEEEDEEECVRPN